MNEEFSEWWDKTGSGILPAENHDLEEHTRRVSEVAFNEAKQGFQVYVTVESIPKIEAQASKDFDSGLFDSNPYHKATAAHHVYDMALKQLQFQKELKASK